MKQSRHYSRLAYVLVLFDAVLCAGIIYRIPYTEIDWVAYMEQVEIFLKGERDYALIKGQTGPLVYPAGHVYVFTALHWLTDNGRDIVVGQIAFAGLYLATLAVTIATYRRANAPLYAYPLLVLSKRLHSIYVLRLFNDGVESFLMSLSTYLYVRKSNTLGSVAFSLAVSVKMNALLYLPGIAMLLIQTLGIRRSLRQALVMLQLQVALAAPFLWSDGLGHATSYLSRAFQFSRVFMHEWTVNWRGVPEDIFLSPVFSAVLLAGHICTILFFTATRWGRPTGTPLARLFKLTVASTLGALFPTGEDVECVDVTQDYIVTTLYSCNLIGIVWSRSLHYQFYAWFAWSIPSLLSKTGLNVPMQVVLWVLQEWAWNVYPSTPASSAVVVLVPSIVLIRVWMCSAHDIVTVEQSVSKDAAGRTTRTTRTKQRT